VATPITDVSARSAKVTDDWSTSVDCPQAVSARDQIQRIWLSTGVVAMTATIRMQDVTKYHVIGEEAAQVRAQRGGPPVVVLPVDVLRTSRRLACQ
jgi:hypothetical protein